MNEYPKEVQDVLDAAVGWLNCTDGDDVLCDAVASYRKSIAPPEPFKALMRWSGDDWECLDDDPEYPLVARNEDEWLQSTTNIWKVTVTPIERVR